MKKCVYGIFPHNCQRFANCRYFSVLESRCMFAEFDRIIRRELERRTGENAVQTHDEN